MEDNTHHDSGFGQEIHSEEEEFEMDDLHPVVPHQGMHFAMWVLVIIAVIIVIFGWLYFTKKSFDQMTTGLEIGSQQTTQEATEQFNDSLKSLGQALEDSENEVTEIQEADVEKQEEADELDEIAKNMVDQLEKAAE